MKYTHNGIDYEAAIIWALIPTEIYLELVHEELEKLHGGPDGVNLLVQGYSAIGIAALIINGIERFKPMGMGPEFIAAIVTEVITSRITSDSKNKGVN